MMPSFLSVFNIKNWASFSLSVVEDVEHSTKNDKVKSKKKAVITEKVDNDSKLIGKYFNEKKGKSKDKNANNEFLL